MKQLDDIDVAAGPSRDYFEDVAATLQLQIKDCFNPGYMHMSCPLICN